jgi:hypothetical protein
MHQGGKDGLPLASDYLPIGAKPVTRRCPFQGAVQVRTGEQLCQTPYPFLACSCRKASLTVHYGPGFVILACNHRETVHRRSNKTLGDPSQREGNRKLSDPAIRVTDYGSPHRGARRCARFGSSLDFERLQNHCSLCSGSLTQTKLWAWARSIGHLGVGPVLVRGRVDPYV